MHGRSQGVKRVQLLTLLNHALLFAITFNNNFILINGSIEKKTRLNKALPVTLEMSNLLVENHDKIENFEKTRTVKFVKGYKRKRLMMTYNLK